MPGKRHTPEQVINKLLEAEVALAQGSTVAEADLPPTFVPVACSKSGRNDIKLLQ